jgi:hypothetical protein
MSGNRPVIYGHVASAIRSFLKIDGIDPTETSASNIALAPGALREGTNPVTSALLGLLSVEGLQEAMAGAQVGIGLANSPSFEDKADVEILQDLRPQPSRGGCRGDGRVEEHSLVPLGEARLSRIGFDEWLRRSQARA